MYADEVANDEEYARMVIASRKAQRLPLRPSGDEKRDSFRTYTTEAAKLDQVIDGLHSVVTAVYRAAGNRSVPTPKPVPRPRTAYDRVLVKERERSHQELAARVLPHKRKNEGAAS